MRHPAKNLLELIDLIEAFKDRCTLSAVDAVQADLDYLGWLKRYRTNDGFGVPTVAFMLCTFWLVEALARLGRQPLDVRLSGLDMLRLLVPFVFNWLVYGAMSFALTASLYPALPWSQAPALTGLFTAAWLIGFLTIIVPQGLVVREGLIFTFLTTLLGVPAPVATAAAILLRLWTMLGEGIWAAISTRL